MDSWENDNFEGSQETQARQGTRAAPPREIVAHRAYHIWQDHGCPAGTSIEDWLQAEAEMRKASLFRSGRRETDPRSPPPCDWVIDEASEESFPASDSPAWTHCACG